jgi:hypothetical protein
MKKERNEREKCKYNAIVLNNENEIDIINIRKGNFCIFPVE